MLWGCFSWHVLGSLVAIYDTFNTETYSTIMVQCNTISNNQQSINHNTWNLLSNELLPIPVDTYQVGISTRTESSLDDGPNLRIAV